MNILLIAATAALGALAHTSPEGKDSLNYKLDSAVVAVSRAGDRTPVTFSMVGREDLRSTSPLNSLPMLLALQPSVVTTNEGGTGIGYSKMTVRGSKGSQINVTLNGITLNDAESQEVFWVNIPALSGILGSVQLQRGLGTSANGVGAFGASINMSSGAVSPEPFASADFGFGAYSTATARVSAGTGIAKNGLYAQATYSKNITDGYIRGAFGDTQSLFLSTGWLSERSSVKFTYLMGDQRTGITWNGIPLSAIQTDRTYNPAGEYTDSEGNTRYYPGETDNYTQHHLQLSASHLFTERLFASATLNYTKGDGYYEQYKTGKKFKAYGFGSEDVADPSEKSDFIINKSMDNGYWVFKTELNYSAEKLKIAGGTYLSHYTGGHFGAVLWNPVLGNLKTGSNIHRGLGFGHGTGSGDGWQWYDNDSRKTEADFWARAEYAPSEVLNAYVDLQYRSIGLRMKGIDDEFSDLGWNGGWDFFNPRAGITYTPASGHKAYASVALGHREPGRSDIKEVIETNNAAGTSLSLKPEKMLDTEFGYSWTGRRLSASAGLYFMEYKDMLLETGKLSDSGYAIKENVPRSWRRGIELAAAYKPIDALKFEANATFSVNQIQNYTAWYEEYDNIDDWHFLGQYSVHFDRTTMLMSPSAVAAGRAVWTPLKGLSVSADMKYVGKQYWDNTASEDRCLPSYAVMNMSASQSFSLRGKGDITLGVYLGNVLNTLYEADAWVYRAHFQGGSAEWYQEEGLFPQAPFNWMLRLTVTL